VTFNLSESKSTTPRSQEDHIFIFGIKRGNLRGGRRLSTVNTEFWTHKVKRSMKKLLKTSKCIPFSTILRLVQFSIFWLIYSLNLTEICGHKATPLVGRHPQSRHVVHWRPHDTLKKQPYSHSAATINSNWWAHQWWTHPTVGLNGSQPPSYAPPITFSPSSRPTWASVRFLRLPLRFVRICLTSVKFVAMRNDL